MGGIAPQLLTVMRGEIDDKEVPAAAQHPRSFGNHQIRRCREMQHLMHHHRINAGRFQWQPHEIAAQQLDRKTLSGKSGPRDTQHFRATINSGHLAGVAAQYRCHTPGAGTDIEQMTDTPVLHQSQDRALHLFLSDVERTDRIPFISMCGEIAFGRCLALGLNGHEAIAVGLCHGAIERRCRQGIGKAQQRLRGFTPPQAHKHPTALTMPLDQPRILKNADVPGDTRLTLFEQQRNLTHRQFLMPQQRQYPETGWIAHRTQQLYQPRHGRRFRRIALPGNGFGWLSGAHNHII